MTTSTRPDKLRTSAAGQGLAIAAQGQPPVLTMSSREIAELTGKEHKNVLADIRKMLDELGMRSADFSAQYRDTTGRALPCFNLPKGLTLTLITGYSVPLRHRINTRWLELEAQQHPKAPALPRSFAEALRLAADQAEELEAQRRQLEQQRPAVEFVSHYVDGTGMMGVRQVAKLLKANERDFVAWLLEHDVMYRLAGRLTPMAAHLAAGRFVVKTGRADNGHAFTEARFTPKGVEWIAGEWGKRAVAALQGMAGASPRQD